MTAQGLAPIIALPLLLLLAMPASDDGPAAAIADQLEQCGLDRAQFSVTGGAYLNGTPVGDIAISLPDPALTPARLTCLVTLATAGNQVMFGDPAAQARFDPLADVANRRARIREARHWLTDRNLLEKLPAYDPAQQTLPDLAASLVTLCPITGGVTVTARSVSLVLMGPDSSADAAGRASFDCIFSAATVLSGDPQRFDISVIFNGAARHH